MKSARMRAVQAMPSIDIIVQSPLWEGEPGVETMLHRTIEEAAAALSTSETELAIVLTDDSAMRLLNRDWRGIDEPTNVLSFPAQTARANGIARLLGDIVIAFETSAREAAAENKPFLHHVAHLAVHGFLHLEGHDHVVDAQADAMERLEREILSRLGVADPYAAHDAKTDG
jgi:probable rRNA maturation factor